MSITVLSSAARTSVIFAALFLVGCTPVDPAESIPSSVPEPSEASATVTRAGVVDGQVVVAGSVTGLISGAGTCTFELVSAGQTATRESAAVADATSTACPEITLPSTELPAGEWTVTMTFADGDVELTSDPLVVEVL